MINLAQRTIAILVLSTSLFCESLPKLESHKSSSEEVHKLTGRDPHVVLGQGIIQHCQEGRKLSDKELQKKLSDISNLNFDPSGGKFDRELAIYLLAYFQVMGYRFSEPVTIKMGMPENTTLVEKKQGQLHFSKNASDNLFTKIVGQEAQKTADERKSELEFTNTLFEQLTEAISTHDFLKSFLKIQFGIDIEANPSSEEEKFLRKLTHKEATMVTKQLIDLPIWVTQNLKLKRILRANTGISNREAAGVYTRSSETITLFDNAFKKGPSESEGTLIHEIGHAYWENLNKKNKVAFKELSWESDTKPKIGSRNFVTQYARKNPEEDFAESFSYFVNNPEKMKNVAPDKYAMLKEDIFDSEFFTTANRKAKVLVPSDKPDTKPPFFLGDLEDLIEITAKTLEKSGEIEVRCLLKSFYDDVSGIKEITIGLSSKASGHETEEACYLILNETHCLNKEKGIYELIKTFNRGEFQKNTKLFSTAIMLKDKAGNETIITTPRKEVEFNGTRVPKDRKEELDIDFDKITIKPEPKVDGLEQSYTVTIPYFDKDLYDMHLRWAHQDRPELELDHTFTSFEIKKVKKININGGNEPKESNASGMELLVHFPKTLPPGNVSLTGVRLEHKKTIDLNEKTYYVNLPKSLKNTSIKITPSAPDLVSPKMDTENLSLTAKKTEKKNSAGGDTNIVLSIPVEGVNTKNGEILDCNIALYTPSGNLKFFVIKKVAPKKENGKDILQIELPLNQNQEKGEYILHYAKIQKVYSGPSETKAKENSQNLNSFFSSTNSEEIKFSERGIRRKISISD